MATDNSAKSVLITGASTGIGKVCALRMDKLGWKVYAGVRKPEDGAELQQEAGPSLTPVIIDVTNSEQIDATAGRIASESGGRLDGVVNNAGIVVAGPLEYLPVDDLRHQLEVNVIGQIAVTQAMLPLIRKATGRIVHIGSSSGWFAAPFVGAYSASKFAMEALADAQRRELRRWNIPVILVEPGAIKTPIWEKSTNTADEIMERLDEEGVRLYEQQIENIREEIKKTEKRANPPETVARAVEHALTAAKPRIRYPVGMDARIQRWISRWIPAKWVDWVIQKAIG